MCKCKNGHLTKEDIQMSYKHSQGDSEEEMEMLEELTYSCSPSPYVS